ncbi:hypothetical protein [Nocardia sp. alder85J]|uniref:hypothetical protein n=1 Tax=Nocardia sp. alder85J TaxID=2862949 RepID=UPI001CD43151|nr:hypothetical protein [Nocardia sp. alder85J]MCX4097285.1 hypothetical protein [Nocardia sp. alder85J]
MWQWSTLCAERAAAATWQSRRAAEPRPTITDPRPWDTYDGEDEQTDRASDYLLIADPSRHPVSPRRHRMGAG